MTPERSPLHDRLVATTLGPVVEFTIKDAASICRRSTKTIRRLIHQHQLPTRYGREPVRGRPMTRRIVLLPPETVARLYRLTVG